jgi:hypothetical protein
LLAACGSSGSDGPETIPPVDPMSLAPQVSETELAGSIQGLEALETRYTIGPGDDNARAYLVERITALGLTAELDPFPVTNETANNIIVRHLGTETPNVVYIFSAHYDSISNTAMTSAPGADDNATGVAAVLEAARLLTKHAFKHSVWFVFTAAEEQGSLGSKHMVQWLATEGVEVRGVIAPDMIGYWPAGDADQFDILGDPMSEPLVEHMADVATRLGVAHKKWIEHGFCYGDDHTIFQEAGIPAISPMDCVEAHNVSGTVEDTPHYHAGSDRFGTLYMPFTTKVASVIVTLLAELAEPVAVPKP